MNNAFSVAMSVYKNDNPAYFRCALESITKHQTMLPNEIVLVVDGPVPDAINSVIDEFISEYKFFNIIRLIENNGLGNAMKLCVENSSNELIARMDADDISTSDRFEQQLKCFKNNSELDIVGGDITEFIGHPENIVGKRAVPKTDKEIKEYIKVRCPFNHMTVMFKKRAVLDCGNYMDLFWNEDYYLWIRMAENKCRFENTGTVLVNVRTGEDMYRRRGGRRYFQSELYLQKYMLQKGIISRYTYYGNVLKRFIVELLLPNRLRGWAFRRFARE